MAAPAERDQGAEVERIATVGHRSIRSAPRFRDHSARWATRCFADAADGEVTWLCDSFRATVPI
jgi:hypothetical protein